MKDDNILLKRVRFLSIYALFSSVLILFLLYKQFSSGFASDKFPAAKTISSLDSLHVTYLTIERADIVEEDGTLAISLSNSKSSPRLRFDGQKIWGASNRDIPNIIFFDGKGDEVGGIAFNNFGEGEPIEAMRHLAFDGLNQDEVITLSHFVQNGESRKGLYIYDRPDIHILDALEEIGIDPADPPDVLGEKLNRFRVDNPARYKTVWGNPRSVALQTNEENEAELALSDSDGYVRIRIAVNRMGEAFIEFLDEDGNSVKRMEP